MFFMPSADVKVLLRYHFGAEMSPWHKIQIELFLRFEFVLDLLVRHDFSKKVLFCNAFAKLEENLMLCYVS